MQNTPNAPIRNRAMSEPNLSYAYVSLVEHQPNTLDFQGRWSQSSEIQNLYFQNGTPKNQIFFQEPDGKYFSPEHPNQLFNLEDFPAEGGNMLRLIVRRTCRPQALSGPVLPNDAVSLGQPAEPGLPDHAESPGQPVELVLLDDAVLLGQPVKPVSTERLKECQRLFSWFRKVKGISVTHVEHEETSECWNELEGCTLQKLCDDEKCFNLMFFLQQQYLAFDGKAVRKRKTREN
jgi:hypothetical protein